MKKANIFFIICIVLISFFTNANSQNTATLYIENVLISSGKFSFEIHFMRTNDWTGGPMFNNYFGNSSWFFDFNTSALSNPVLTYKNSNYVTEGVNYYTNSVTITGGEIGVTTTKGTQLSTLEVPLNTKVHIYTVELDIDNPSAQADLYWNSINTGIFNFWDNSVDETYSGNGDISLPVTISNIMGAASRESGIVLTWRVESEVNCLGFNILRSPEESGTYTRVNTELIPGRGNASTAMEYHFNDRNVEDNVTYWYKIEEEMTTGHKNYYGPVSIVGISPVPKEFALDQNYPNPFNPETTIKYQLPKDGRIHIAIYSLLGEKVADLVDEVKQAGYYSAVWKGMDGNGNQVASGIYFIWMNSGEFRSVRKVTLLR